MRKIRVGSRESRLAVAQAELVMNAIRRLHPGADIELTTMRTTGDRIQDRPLDSIGGKGLFVKELDDALRDGRVDICVHSYKDMPVPGDPGLPVVAVSPREDPRDVLVLPQGMDGGPDGEKPLGTSSARRRRQAEEIFPGWRVEPVRGNVLTRLRKLDEGRYGGLMLAAAGLRRLGLRDRVCRTFDVREMIPAACQGILAIQGRAGEEHGYLEGVNDPDAWDASVAERAFVEALDGGCSAPTAAYAELDGDRLVLRGFHVGASGKAFRGTEEGRRVDARRIGTELAERLREEGVAGER